MKALKSKLAGKPAPVKNSKRPVEPGLDNTSGEGAASALASLRKMERNRERSKPSQDPVDE